MKTLGDIRAPSAIVGEPAEPLGPEDVPDPVLWPDPPVVEPFEGGTPEPAEPPDDAEGLELSEWAPAGRLTDGTETEGVVTDGTFTEGTVTDGTVIDGTVIEGTVIEGTVIDGTVTEGTLTEGVASDGRTLAPLDADAAHGSPTSSTLSRVPVRATRRAISATTLLAAKTCANQAIAGRDGRAGIARQPSAECRSHGGWRGH